MDHSIIALAALLAAPAAAGTPTAESLLEKYDAVMGPPTFEAVAEMTAHRDDGSTRTYKMKVLKSGTEKLRVWFQEPAAVRGQEMLRQGENLWVYLPNLKKPTRLASRESFQGGDFNNADVLRVHYQADYSAQVLPASALPDAWELELRAKSPDAAYERIKLWLRKADGMPVKGEYYTASGKMLRMAEFSDVKSFGGFKRPAKIVMKNMLAPKRHSEMVMLTFNTRASAPASKFVLDDLGR